jgi:hypothetical protein
VLALLLLGHLVRHAPAHRALGRFPLHVVVIELERGAASQGNRCKNHWTICGSRILPVEILNELPMKKVYCTTGQNFLEVFEGM